jgi:acyl-coenzyme A thioesterase PaaI-like protein
MPHDEGGPSLQERHAPHSTCFGCGPANAKGLRIRSFPQGDGLVTTWQPEPHHEAFEGALNGGIIGTLFDCHCNWTAAWRLMQDAGGTELPSTVTAGFHVRFHRPTPSAAPVTLRSRVVEASGDRATVEAVLESQGTTCAVGGGTFVAVGPGHPAYHRWGEPARGAATENAE